MTSNPTTPPREAVRRAVACWTSLAHRGGPACDTVSAVLLPEPHNAHYGARPSLAVDNSTGGGLVARLRASFDKIAWDDIEAQYREIGHDQVVQLLTERVCKALGVTP